MTTLHNLHDVVTACGNVLRGGVQVNGRDYIIESDGETWVNIIDDKSCCETCVIDGKDVIAEGGEYVTGDWTDADWTAFTAFVFWTPKNN
jgi:hypothetical protein